jgi:molybdopterin/thiamine biosynthesis adenylyltransferase
MSADEERYQRHLSLPEIGVEGQRRLSRATVLVAGCGALGSTQAELLARAGIGTLRLVDHDVVQLGNLQRQALYTEEDVRERRTKVEAAARHLQAINSGVDVEIHCTRLGESNLPALVRGADLVLDGLDNFPSRYLVNDTCVELGVPWVHGGVVGTSGNVLAVVPGRGPCLRCVFPKPPPAGVPPLPETDGLLNTLPHLVASLQVTAALRLLLRGDPPPSSLLMIDPWRGTFDRLTVARDPECPGCGRRGSRDCDRRARAFVSAG